MTVAPDRPAGGSRAIARTALLLLPLQVVFRGGEAVLPLLLATWFGRNADTDLYYLLAAYFIFASAFVAGAFQDSGVVPVLVEVAQASPGDFPDVAGALLGYTLIIGGGVAAATGSLATAGLALASKGSRLAYALVVAMAVGVLVTGIRSYYVGLLNARGRFRAHPLCSGVGMALTLSLLYSSRRALGVVAIPCAVIAGDTLAIALLAWVAANAFGVRARPSLQRLEPVQRMLRLVRLEVAGSLITRINPVVDQLVAGLAAVVGGGTILRYATDVASLPTSVLQATLFPVLLTRLAEETARPARFLATTKETLAAVVAILAVASGALALARGPLCSLLFLHGAMDASGVARIASVLPWALAGVAPFGALLVLARAHVALQNSRIMPSMGVLNSALNAGLNLLLVGPLGLGGIALSTSITYVVVASVFWWRLPGPARA